MTGLCEWGVLALAFLGAGVAAAAPSNAKRVSRTYVQTLAAGPSAVFPLLGPLEEARWAEGWQPRMIHPADGTAVEGAVFVTRHDGEAEKIWVLTTWDAVGHRVGYVHFTPGSDVTEIRIHLRGPAAGPTEATVTYAWTSLGEAGDSLVLGQSEQRFRHAMEEWETALNHYLRTGRRLAHPEESR